MNVCDQTRELTKEVLSVHKNKHDTLTSMHENPPYAL